MIPRDDYAALAGTNYTLLKEGLKSPKHLKYRFDNPRKDTDRYALGRGGHAAILEPARFESDFVCWGERRAGKRWEEFEAEHEGLEILKTEAYEAARDMGRAVRSHPLAGPLLAQPGEAEKIIQWTDPISRLVCKARLDWLCAEALVDIKTAAELDARVFARLVVRYGYHLQAAFYRMGCRIALNVDPPVKIIAVEPTAPYDVAVFTLDDNALYAGEIEARRLLDMVASCTVSGHWPGRYETEIALELPPWAWPAEESDGLGISISEEEAAL